jgi:hypothetical protein
MPCAEELKQIAADLKNDGLTKYFKDWNFPTLQAFIRDGGRCVYCGGDAMGGKGEGDHLFPRQYSELEDKVENKVTACVYCNRLKAHCDPSKHLPAETQLKLRGKGAELILTEKVRQELVIKIENELDMKKKGRDMESEFEIANARFGEAVAKYRKCKESVVQASSTKYPEGVGSIRK